MKDSKTLLNGLRRALNEPRQAVRWLVELERDRKFVDWPGAYHGVYPTFAAAIAAAPKAKLGFNHVELADIYDHRLHKAFPSDYPVLFWLDRLLHENRSVFDWGGHIGVSYYAYQRYLTLPEDLRWRVCEVPEIAKAGARLAAEKGEGRLTFTTEPSEASGFRILIAAGSLQYLETSLASDLQALEQRPEHLLINKLPLYDGDDFVTLQNTVHSFNPYKIQNRRNFVQSILALGYEAVDEWETPDMACRIPLHPEHSIRAYSGFYFRANTVPLTASTSNAARL
jgi:putative methyltransferase (TIGR04325 family)